MDNSLINLIYAASMKDVGKVVVLGEIRATYAAKPPSHDTIGLILAEIQQFTVQLSRSKRRFEKHFPRTILTKTFPVKELYENGAHIW